MFLSSPLDPHVKLRCLSSPCRVQQETVTKVMLSSVGPWSEELEGIQFPSSTNRPLDLALCRQGSEVCSFLSYT